ncbi:hypothetical protein AMS68_004521 [Peltaster fructicola]|uniref:tRNA(Ile)-lysidine/2-thiocytidine synthase N-terminal domain-containing protein n=1 Tax=Peltaster fructicola TaxID=286661 RepID=A0A6H0XWA4_9PEZI|nr:hypothetical protein AMS68_004521 [Peltaster fructicola]
MIGAACRDHNIETLLVAHHADDQAETVLIRLINNYLGMGLRGIQSVSTMDGETARYGIYQSGKPRRVSSEHALALKMDHSGSQPVEWLNASSMLTEAGGISLIRPLLQFSKSDLIATCLDARISWVEDQTNKDVSLATRNTLRYMNENELLPQALRAERLQALSSAITAHRDTYSAFIEELIDQAEILIDTSCSRVICTFSASAVHSIQIHSCADHIRATLLHELISIVASKEHLSTNMLNQSTIRFLQPHDEGPTYQEAGVGITSWLQPDGAHSYEMLTHNVRSTVEETPLVDWVYDLSKPADIVRWSDWQLWQGRYWLRLGYRVDVLNGAPKASVRYRRKGDDQITSAKEPRLQELFQLHKRRCKIPKAAAYAMPVIAAGPDDEIVAFPAYGISNRRWALVEDESDQLDPTADCFYMIRYKQLPAWATEPLCSNRHPYQQSATPGYRKLSRSRPFPPLR